MFGGSRKERGWQTARCHLALRRAGGAARAPAPAHTTTVYLLSHTQLQVKAIYKYGLHLGVHLLKPRPHSTDFYTTVGRLSSGCLQTLSCIGKQSSYSRPAAFGYIHVSVTCTSLILRPHQPATVCVKILTEEDVVDLA